MTRRWRSPYVLMLNATGQVYIAERAAVEAERAVVQMFQAELDRRQMERGLARWEDDGGAR